MLFKNKRAKLLRFIDNLKIRVLLTRYLLDTPRLDYQPLPWIGISKANVRGKETIDRWNSIKNNLNNSKNLKDIGCCVGYFCHSAVSELDMRAFGYDLNDNFIFIANHTKKFLKNSEKETFCQLKIDPKSVKFLPTTDATLLLSIWHHWVLNFGLDEATSMLREVWKKTEKVLFFESGEEEVLQEFKLPSSTDAKFSIWLKNYLSKTLDDSRVNIISTHKAGSYDHYKKKDQERSLFCISRNG